MKTAIVNSDIYTPDILMGKSFRVSYDNTSYDAIGLLERNNKLYAILTDSWFNQIERFELREVSVEGNGHGGKEIMTIKDSSIGEFTWIKIPEDGKFVNYGEDTLDDSSKVVHTFTDRDEAFNFISKRI